MEDTAARVARLNATASSLAQKGSFRPAALLLQQAVRLQPTHAPAQYNLGVVLAQLGMLQAATVRFQRALHLDPMLCDAAVNLGGALLKESRLSASEAACWWAHQLDPARAEAAFNLNNVLRRRGRIGDAVEFAWQRVAAMAGPAFARPVPLLVERRPALDAVAASLDSAAMVCVKWGSKYSAEYVNRLARGVQRHTSSFAGRRLVCFTDDSTDVLPDLVECRPLPQGWSGWWNKALLFVECEGLAERIVYIDLDSVVVGDLSFLLQYAGDCMVLGCAQMVNEGRTEGYNSSVMCWRSGWGTEITQVLAAHREAVQGVVHRFDHWLEMLIPDAELVDALYPDHVVEFKAACAHAPPPAAARLVTFPLHPKPHHQPAAWVDAMWRGELLMEERAIPVTLVCHGPLADQCMAFVQTTAFGGMMGGVGPGSCGLDAH